MGYLHPIPDDVRSWVSSSWRDHQNRKPPSGEPGTDYAAARHTPILCANPGKVIEVKKTNTSAGGRWVTVLLDDGLPVRYEHMQTTKASVGQRVTRGSVLGTVGGSGHGSDNAYGTHVHVALWPRRALLGTRLTIDFDLRVGNDEPAVVDPPKPLPTPEPAPLPEEEDDLMRPKIHVRLDKPAKDGGKATEWMRAHPLIGLELDQYTGPGTGTKRKSADGKVTTFRGFEVTTDPSVGGAWERIDAHGMGTADSRTTRDEPGGYIAIQVEESRLSAEIGPALAKA